MDHQLNLALGFTNYKGKMKRGVTSEFIVFIIIRQDCSS